MGRERGWGLAGSLESLPYSCKSSTVFNLGLRFMTIFICFKGIKTSNQYLEVHEQLAEHFIHLFPNTKNDHLCRCLEGAGPELLPRLCQETADVHIKSRCLL